MDSPQRRLPQLVFAAPGAAWAGRNAESRNADRRSRLVQCRGGSAQARQHNSARRMVPRLTSALQGVARARRNATARNVSRRN